MTRTGSIILKLLGLLLIVAAALKWHQLYTAPVPGNTIWTYRPFLIAQFTGELAFGLWLISPYLRKPAWLMALLCFIFFFAVTLYKWITGADSCGCFGEVHVAPWKTLFFIDLPAIIALILFGPKKLEPWFTPPPSWRRLAIYVVFCLALLAAGTISLALHEPQARKPSGELGQRLQILDSIDVADTIGTGNWLLFFYRHNCDDCHEAMPRYLEFARQFGQTEGFLRVAFIAIPAVDDEPIEDELVEPDPAWLLGKLDDDEEWFVSTPVIVLLSDGIVTYAIEGEAPDTNELLEKYLAIVDGQ